LRAAGRYRRARSLLRGMTDVASAGYASLEPPLHAFSTSRRLCGEALGTALLLAIVIGSGIMGERLASGNVAIALLGNTVATGAGLVVLITIFGPLSGAHFKPAVTLVFALRREIGWGTAAAYAAAQCVGGVLGVWAAHAMFAEPIWQLSTKLRDGPAQVFAEFVATFGLIAAILGSIRFRPAATPMVVGLYITSAYWFTASTSFANPAVTIARSLSDTFAGIAPRSAPLFIVGQLLGALAASVLFGWLLKERKAP
jgi:glycerol uptake facilitator-like aquaporin